MKNQPSLPYYNDYVLETVQNTAQQRAAQRGYGAKLNIQNRMYSAHSTGTVHSISEEESEFVCEEKNKLGKTTKN